jgi:tRNA-2-methylthio-N6-dimethylallyladenosine synthase
MTRQMFLPVLMGATLISWTSALVQVSQPWSSTALDDPPPPRSVNEKWLYPRRIQDTTAYDAMVERLYVRHIVTETREMAQLCLSQYSNLLLSSTDEDPFGQVAHLLSACSFTKQDGGKVGWVDRSDLEMKLLGGTVLPLFQLQPKAGDIHILQSPLTEQFHVVQVVELWMRAPTATDLGPLKISVVGSYQGSNQLVPRKPLPGHGVMPTTGTEQVLRSYEIQTTGCQMNVADSERLQGVLQNELQLQPRSEKNIADVVIFNTCSIRDHAEQKLYDALGPFAARKRRAQASASLLIVTGCVAQQEGRALLYRIPEIDIVMGPQYIPFLPAIVQQVRETGQQMVVTQPFLLKDPISLAPSTPAHSDRPITPPVEAMVSTPPQSTSSQISRNIVDSMLDTTSDWSRPSIVRGHSVRAFVNVIHGCNEHCTYCVVPATRGMEQSRPVENIVEECRQLACAGYREVTLLGQNIDAYGRDMTPKRTFADLLISLNNQLAADDTKNGPGISRIRYVTSHPRYFSDRVIDAVLDLDKVCECFHVPFQAGDDAVLKGMRRGYTFDSYMRIIEKIRSRPGGEDAAICGDVIVGFPGETDQAFAKTLRLMEQVKFDNLNTFAYSPRPNTQAALWTDPKIIVPEHVKADRLQAVQKLAVQHGYERSCRYLNRTVEVLVEDVNPRNPTRQVVGRTRQGRQVYFDGSLEHLKGKLVNVEITEARAWSLVGNCVL